MTKPFLQADWRKLVMANYPIDKKMLNKYLPDKTEIDTWNKTCYVSLVGFMFIDTKLKGLKFPFHSNFEEVNLRFYVRHNDNGTWKRGVVFIKEIVPKPALTFIANAIYREKYETLPMKHSWSSSSENLVVEYKWKKSRWNSLMVTANKHLNLVRPDSEEEFITEHYWGYTKLTERKTSEYRVEHPKWSVYQTSEYLIDVDFADIYGSEFNFLKTEKPASVFLAEGSEIQVKSNRVL
jgi:uncharacterized protein